MRTPRQPPKPYRVLKHHIFVCTNERPPGHPRGCCKEQGSEAVLQALKTEVAKAGLQAEVRAQKSGCLDTCEYGPSVVVYPDAIWYGPVMPEDAREIVQSHLLGGKRVDRLLIPGKN